MVASALGSLVFDCEVCPSDDSSVHGSCSTSPKHEADSIVQRLELLTRASCPFARELRNYVQQLQVLDREMSARVLAGHLAALGYDVSVRTVLPGHGPDCFKSLRHEFLIVRGSGEYAGMEFLVEQALKLHFTIPHPAPDYALVLSRVPDVYVGGTCRLAPLIQLLCGLMADSFARQGLTLPPWRREAAMLSKWLAQPHRIRDAVVTAPPTSPQPVLPFVGVAQRTASDLADGAMAQSPLAMTPTTAFLDFSRTESSTSNVSASDCGGGVSLGCSPTAELAAPQLPSPLYALTPAAECAGGDASGGGSSGKFWAVHGFIPRPVTAAAAVPLHTADQGVDSDVADSGAGGGGGVDVSVSGSIGSVFGKSAGLLAARLQQRRDAAGTADGGGSGGDGGALIRTRAPVHPGEMAIRVVKLVGFPLPDDRQQQQPNQAPRSAAASPHRGGGVGGLPWRQRAVHARAF